MRNSIVHFVVACVCVGCGGQSRGPNGVSGGATGGGGSSGHAPAEAGDNGTAGTPTAAAGASSGSGGTRPGSGGAASAGRSGAPTEDGGASGKAGSAASSGASGSATGGAAGGCVACQPLEQCGKSKLCVGAAITVPAGFAIDATEVTRAQYAAWLATNPATVGQQAACSWNSSFTPEAACMAKASVCQGSQCGQHPQVCVDACDARAYCTAVGKQLCGGPGGGPATASTDATKSQWFNACSSGGVNTFAYGTSLAIGTCNDGTSGNSTTTVVGGKPDCHSSVAGYTGIFDLNGNVWEWEDNCMGSSGQADICNPRGAAFGSGAALPNCAQGLPTTRASVADNVGFRCCQ